MSKDELMIQWQTFYLVFEEIQGRTGSSPELLYLVSTQDGQPGPNQPWLSCGCVMSVEPAELSVKRQGASGLGLPQPF